MMVQEDRQKAWTHAASRLCRRVNLGWWYQEFYVFLILVALLAGSWALVARRYEWELGSYFWIGAGTLILSAIVVAWCRSKKNHLDLSGAFVRLEADLGLDNSLTTAVAERGPWPAFERSKPVLRWRFDQLAFPLLAALALLIFGLAVPIAPAGEAVEKNQPYTWSRLEAEVDELVEQEVIQEDYAAEIKKRLDELRNQKAEEWFSAASLEATDSLQQAHSREATRLERDLMKMEKALRKAADPAATEEQRQQLQEQFQEALEGMRGGQMKANEELLNKLEEAAKEGMKNLTGDQLDELRKKLQEMADQLGEEEGEGEGNPDDTPGNGNTDRGPGSPMQLYGDLSPDLEMKKFEHLDGKGPDDEAPGDLLKLEEIEHDVDRSQKAASTSGAASSTGLGGDRVWKDSLDPDEQKSLKSFFE